MDRTDQWKLADELNVYQIALLIAGYDPSDFHEDSYEHWPQAIRKELNPFLSAIKNAARSQKFKFTEVRYSNQSYDEPEINWYESLIEIDGLRDWLRSRNFSDGFFVGTTRGDRLSDMAGEFYAPKLAAAVRAWNEVTCSPDALNGKTPKKALEIWLRKHANEYGLTGKDGNPNALGIEEICKVANWKPGGGASPTPVGAVPSPGSSANSRKVKPRPPTPQEKPTARQRVSDALDDDIPF